MPLAETLVTDSLFGPLTVRLETGGGVVEVEGQTIPRVVLRRATGTKATNEEVPVGTRKAGLLTLTVDGEGAALAPGRGRLIRRSYRVDVRHRGHLWRLVPHSMTASRLLRNGQRLGSFASRGDGRVTADWRPTAKPDATDAALGYALAAAFGTGAEPLWASAVDGIGDLIP
ncbi:hypothetical protein [Streptomyces sp. RG80]|uniref:hypothetical protein n=1 Tax=Streptomyces sp. RG80 TaxID=3157340 RepID=UPI00338FC584